MNYEIRWRGGKRSGLWREGNTCDRVWGGGCDEGKMLRPEYTKIQGICETLVLLSRQIWFYPKPSPGNQILIMLVSSKCQEEDVAK